MEKTMFCKDDYWLPALSIDKELDPAHDIMECSYNVSTTTIDTNSFDGDVGNNI
jgi:hypothetical protein